MIRQGFRIGGAILAFVTSAAGANWVLGRQVDQHAVTPQSQQSAMSKSGALLALDNGQTLWIAPVNGKIQVIAADDYVIPRKDGFWRVRLELRELPSSSQKDAAQGEGGLQSQLWAVPLKKGKNAIAWEATPAASKKDQDSGAQEQEQTEQDMQTSEEDEPYRQEVHFLSSDHISFFTQTGEYSSTYGILKIEDQPAKPGHGTEALLVSGDGPSLSDEARAKDIEKCADPKDELANEDFLSGASEVSYGIVRTRGKWRYTWLLGYNGGVARGYHVECGVATLPGKSVVGPNELFPGWAAIKDAYPDAEDAFSSPTHDMILVLYQNTLVVAPLQDGKAGRPLTRLTLGGKPVMVQWALGKYVDAWTKELTPYFGAYEVKAQTQP